MSSRYATDVNYRLVRTRPGQREADLDIHEFSLFHKDQPDGVVKLIPCNPGTQVTGGGGGGGGVRESTAPPEAGYGSTVGLSC